VTDRLLGATGIEVGEVGIGTWELSGDVWGPKDDDVSMAALRAGLEAGANFVDTAADYGDGHVERLVGRLLSEGVARHRLVISTKVRPRNGVWAPPPETPMSDCFPAAWIRSECEESLRRLGTDHVDVLFLHTWSRSWGHHDDWYEAMAALRDEGMIRAIGISVSDDGVGDANVPIARGQVDVIQCVHSVFQQEPEVTLYPLAERFGVGIVARSPFSSGALVSDWASGVTFAPGDWRATWPAKVRDDWLEDQARMAALVDEVATGSGLPKPAFCLKYVLGSPAVSVVIPGSADPAHVRDNVLAPTIGPPVTPEARLRLRDLWKHRQIHGTYNGSA
jgi:aryl-alcohol dehydrogenase-like predicted oxidoreductase